MTNPFDTLVGLKGGSINYGKAIEAPSRDKGIMASYSRCHVGPAFAATLGVMILVSAVMWICSAISSATTSMKSDNKIGSGDRPRRDDRSFNQGNRPGRNNNRR